MLTLYKCAGCDKELKDYSSKNLKYCSKTCQYGSTEENYTIIRKTLKTSQDNSKFLK